MKLHLLIASVACLGLSTVAFSANNAQSMSPTVNNKVTTVNKTINKRAENAKSAATSRLAAAKQTVNINSADAKTLATLTGIGKSKAQAIVKFRKQQGKFKSVEDLAKVKGISEKIVSKNRKRLTIG